jgi:succinate dehydrogenase / fumarate reductase flavoprotein subunit
MQGLADGYFVLPYTIGDYLAPLLGEAMVDADHDAFRRIEKDVRARIDRLLGVGGTRSVDWFHRELGRIVWDNCGMSRSRESLEKALSEIPALREEFQSDVRVLGDDQSLNESLEKAGRVEDFFELAELMCQDALYREESCGGHFREEHQTEEGEALRDDENFSHVAAWEFNGAGQAAGLHIEPLEFEYVAPTQRSYK